MILGKIKSFLKRITDRRPVIKCEITALQPSELLKGRCALITGGTSGIGYSIAEAFLNAGAEVILTGRSMERLTNTCEKLSEKGKIRGFVLDNTNVSTFEEVLSTMLAGDRKIDILVNNAGVNYQGMPNVVEEEYDQVLDTNLKGTFFLSQLFGKYMVANEIKGNILNICSASSLRPANSPYTLSKWGYGDYVH